MLIDWQTSLYGCLEDSSTSTAECLDQTFCCFCELSRQYVASTEGISDTYSFPILLISPCTFHCLYFFLRRQVIQKYHIDESCVLSCCTVTFCGTCSMCQVHRELDYHNVWCGTTLPASCIEKKNGRPGSANYNTLR